MNITQWQPYQGDCYLDYNEISHWLQGVTTAFPEWLSLTSIGASRLNAPLWLLSIGKQDGKMDHRPGFWLDGGTHAAEWAGIMACVYSVSEWVKRIEDGDADFLRWLEHHTVYVMPCVSPDGFSAMFNGEPFLRSCLRPPALGKIRSGLTPTDLDGDGHIRWMRWPHPAGPYVQDESLAGFMRPRTLEDSPEDAFFFAPEGVFIAWDGYEWKLASREFGLDLNRNFPSYWAPFSMFGMDGGSFSLSEPESRALIDAFTDRPYIGAALTNHTYTGCILTQPSRADSPLGSGDILLLERMAHQIVESTSYKVYRIHPEFEYDKNNPVVGLWSDTITTTLGVPAYTLELWDPFQFCGLQSDDPMSFFMKPDHNQIRSLVEELTKRTQSLSPWREVSHPQLGKVEVGGLDYMKTVRNPPESALEDECKRAFRVADKLRRSLANVKITTEIVAQGNGHQIRFQAENFGYLSTLGLEHARKLPGTPYMSVELEMSEGMTCVSGPTQQSIPHLSGWGQDGGSGPNALYPSLSGRSHRSSVLFSVQGEGSVTLRYTLGKGGQGAVKIDLPTKNAT